LDELLQALYEASIGHKREDQLRVVLLALLTNTLESDDPRSGVWAELFKDLYAESCSLDWTKLKAELLETTRDAMDDAVDLAIDNYKRGA
tara:strand:+ start:146 stop:415 length:270 start_codon:yes stop_codon:yes gene_type:complete